MAGPPPMVAAVRRDVRRALADLAPAELVLVAASGGPDSTALAAAVAFEAPRRGLRAGLLTVDHAWSADSGARAAEVAELGRRLGLDPVEVLPAQSPRSEGAARDARRNALFAACARLGAAALLLGHTADDQAETVLMRLARGSGSRSLAGMPAHDGLLRRPLLERRRSETRDFCAASGLAVWDDPANTDPAFLRSRVRAELLPVLTDVLGPGAVPALARSAAMLREDADALDAVAVRALREAGDPGEPGDRDGSDDTESADLPDALVVDRLLGLERAVRTRVLRTAALRAGCPPTDLAAGHVAGLDALVTDWHGQGPLTLPGAVSARRRGGRIEFGSTGQGRPGVRRVPPASREAPHV